MALITRRIKIKNGKGGVLKTGNGQNTPLGLILGIIAAVLIILSIILSISADVSLFNLWF